MWLFKSAALVLVRTRLYQCVYVTCYHPAKQASVYFSGVKQICRKFMGSLQGYENKTFLPKKKLI